MRHIIIGTAGHIDHGKTALVKALTGIDCDRLEEEKRRGMTIDLGFAFLDLEGGQRVGFVDVPGHERFIKNMLAGATGIDLALLVIAADDGVMPQTVEHLEILDLLKIRSGLIALNKADMIESLAREKSAEWLTMLTEDIRKTVRGTVLEGAPILPVSALTGQGIPELKKAIAGLVSQLSAQSARRMFRMPIDRAFAMEGFGCVVTGSLAGGEVKVGDEVELLPAMESVRVRGIEVHGQKVDAASAGQRAGINLAGVKTANVERGFELAVPGYLKPTYMLDCTLRYLGSARRPLENRSRIRFHIATSEVMGRVLLLDREILKAGEEALVQFHLEKPVVAERGDRYVIRSYSPTRTIGGGVVLRTATRKLKPHREDALAALRVFATGDVQAIAELLFRDAVFTPLAVGDIVRGANVPPDEAQAAIDALLKAKKLRQLGPVLLHADNAEKLAQMVLAALKDFHAKNPYRGGMDESELRAAFPPYASPSLLPALLSDMTARGLLRLSEHKLSLPGFAVTFSADEQKTQQTLERLFLEGRFAPPTLEEALSRVPGDRKTAQRVVNVLVEKGILVRVSLDLCFHATPLAEIKDLVVGHIKAKGSITAGELRTILNTSRKYAVPLMEYLDNIHVTRRVGDQRVLAG